MTIARDAKFEGLFGGDGCIAHAGRGRLSRRWRTSTTTEKIGGANGRFIIP